MSQLKRSYDVICFSEKCSGNNYNGVRFNVSGGVSDCPKCKSALYFVPAKWKDRERMKKTSKSKEFVIKKPCERFYMDEYYLGPSALGDSFRRN